MSQQKLSIFALSPWETLVSPIRAIKIGSWRLVMFSGFLIATTFFFFNEAFWTWDKIIGLLPVAPSFGITLKALGRMGWFFAIPFLVASISVPVRIIWFSHSIKFKDIWAETLPTIRRCWEAMRFTKLRFFVFVIALHQLIHQATLRHSPNVSLIIQLCIIAIIICIFHWVFCVLVATNTNVGVLYGIQQGSKILKHKWLNALLVISVTVASLLLARFWIYGVSFLEAGIHKGDWISFCIAGWYSLTALSVLTLEASEAHARAQGLTFRKELAAPDE